VSGNAARRKQLKVAFSCLLKASAKGFRAVIANQFRGRQRRAGSLIPNSRAVSVRRGSDFTRIEFIDTLNFAERR
jgi:hypothetical protein